jgi:hypothetical protein
MHAADVGAVSLAATYLARGQEKVKAPSDAIWTGEAL